MPVIDLGSVVGPQGPQGATGATGAQGVQGNPGPNQVTNQTSTNLAGVLFGSQSKVMVKPVDATPTANSGNLVSSGGVAAAIPAAYNSNPAMDGTASAGSSGAYAKGDHVHPSDTSRCRMMTVTIPAGKSADILVTGSNYGPNHSFILTCTGNAADVRGVWLCYGLGIRTSTRSVLPLHTGGGGSLTVTISKKDSESQSQGEYIVENANSSVPVVVTVAVMQEAGGSLSLSDPY